MTYASAAAIRRDVAELLRPPKRISVSEAAEQYMHVMAANGTWRSWDKSSTPYMAEPMDTLNSREFDAVIFAGPARTGKTNALVDGWAAYDIKCDPSDFLIVQISREKAAEFSKKRIDRMLQHSPGLRECVSPRHHDNNIHDKIFRAGNYLKIGWPAKTVLASSDYRRVAITDYDKIPRDIDGEGDGFGQGRKRTQVFMSRGMTLAEGSPGFEVTDPHWRPSPAEPHAAPPTAGILALFNQGDRRQLYWPCPFCNSFFPARFEFLRWDERETDILTASESVTCCCPTCGSAEIEPRNKASLIADSRWVREGQGVDCNGVVTGEARRSRLASFWMEGPAAAFQTWQQLVYNYLAAEQDYDRTGNQERLKTTINTDQGRPYAHRRNRAARSSERLADRAVKQVEKRLIPEGVRFLIACVDVQGGKDRRFVVQVHGFGEQLECWLIDRYNIKKSARKDNDEEEFPIDPAGHPEDWDQLTRYVIDKGYALADGSGRDMPVSLMVFDHGGEAGVSENAYRYYRRLKKEGKHRRAMAVKGGSHTQAEKVKESWPDNTKRANRTSTARGDVPLYLLSANQIKDIAAAHLEREEPGPGYIHFPHWLGQWFYDELTYEERGNDGKWLPPGNGANEAWDLYYYALAGCFKLKADRINWAAPPSWAKPWDENPDIKDPNSEAPEPAPVRRQRRTRFRFS